MGSNLPMRATDSDRMDAGAVSRARAIPVYLVSDQVVDVAKRSPFEPDHTRAADRRRDLTLPKISAQARELTPREESLLRKADRLRRQLERSSAGTPSAKTLERKRRVRR